MFVSLCESLHHRAYRALRYGQLTEQANNKGKHVFYFEEERVMLYRMTYRKIDHNQCKCPPAD